jgi:hypothetical protein
MRWIQYCAGTSKPVLEDTETELPHLESSWIASMRQYLQDVGGTIQLDDTGVLERQREGDSFIMDYVTQHPQFQPGQIKRVQYCRLYLGVTTVSEICNAAGTAIIPALYKGDKSSVETYSRWHNVHQKKPDARSWAQWRRACRLFSTHSKQVLHQRLGNWIVPKTSMRRNWTHWHNPQDDTLYQATANGHYTSHTRLRHDFDKDTTGIHAELPAAAVPADTKEHTDTWSVTPHHISWNEPTPPPLEPNDIYLYINTLRPWEKDLLDHLDLAVLQQEFFQILTTQSIIIATDGSVQGQMASFGWIMSTSAGHRIAICKGPSYGSKPASYRAEGYGLLSATRLLHHLKIKYTIQPTCLIVCDSKSMVKKASNLPTLDDIYANSTLASEWDILAEIWTTLHMYDNPDEQPSFQHVKSHQDDKRPYDELSLKEQLNVDADQLADQYIVANPDHQYNIVPMLPTSGVQLNLPHGTVTYKIKRELRLARTTGPLKEYLCKKYGWTEATFEDIDWECNRRALNRADKDRTIMIKHLNDIVPVGKQVHRYDPKHPESCPSCDETVETSSHLHTCLHPSRQKWRNTFIQKLRTKLEAKDTPLDMMELMLEGIMAVIQGRETNTIHIPETVTNIAAAQEAIGWEQVLRGKLSQQWQRRQQAHLGDRATKKDNGQTWATAIITFILEQWKDLWILRNGDRHGRDAQSRAQALNRQAIRELEQLYTLKGEIQPCHDWILQPPLEERKQMRTNVMRAWINSFKPILDESYKERLNTG